MEKQDSLDHLKIIPFAGKSAQASRHKDIFGFSRSDGLFVSQCLNYKNLAKLLYSNSVAPPKKIFTEEEEFLIIDHITVCTYCRRLFFSFLDEVRKFQRLNLGNNLDRVILAQRDKGLAGRVYGEILFAVARRLEDRIARVGSIKIAK